VLQNLPLCNTLLGREVARDIENQVSVFVAYASIKLFELGTNAMFDVIAPSIAFSVEASGCDVPFAQSVRWPSPAEGTPNSHCGDRTYKDPVRVG